MATYFNDPTENAWRGYCAAALAAHRKDLLCRKGGRRCQLSRRRNDGGHASMPAIGAQGDMDLRTKAGL